MLLPGSACPLAAEFKRPTSNLVKIASHTKDKPPDNRNLHPLHAPITEWIGADCPVDFLNVWFPAHWAPIVLGEFVKTTRERCGPFSLVALSHEVHTACVLKDFLSLKQCKRNSN